MDPLIPAFEDCIFNSEIKDVGTELTELGIDSLIDNPIAESIPFAKTVIALAKTAQNIHDRNLLIQTFNFAAGFNDGTIDAETIQKYRKRISTNTKYAEAELGRILIILDKTIEKNKSVIIGRLFRAYVMGQLSWLEFCELSEATSGLYLSDIPFLLQASVERIDDPDSDVSYRGNRLNALGLVTIDVADAKTTVHAIHIGSFVTISDFGMKFVKYGLNKQ